MRWPLLVVLGACSFDPGRLGSSGGQDGSISDGPISIDAPVVAIDAEIDAMALAGHRRLIEVVDAKVTGGPHANFPMLVSITADWLKSAGDGADIYFSADLAGETKLAFDVESYDPTAGSLVAWVKIPSLSASTALYIQYGDASVTTSLADKPATWSNGYKLVAHMDGNGDATGKNTTNNGLALSPGNGKIGPARVFNGTTSYATLGSDAAIANIFDGGGTIEGWFFADSYGESGYGHVLEKTEYALFVDDTNAEGSLGFWHNTSGGDFYGQWHFGTNTTTTGTWHHAAIVFDTSDIANTPTAVIDGVVVVATEDDAAIGTYNDDSAGALYLGNNAAQSRTFDGKLDEIRYSAVSRSTSWLKTQFANANSPGAFYTVGPEL